MLVAGAALALFFAQSGPRLIADVSGQGMAKPVADLRDYNGTLLGSPGTGRVHYTSLYRGNNDAGATSGCEGEGCGSNPGVDIGVNSGTNVYAAANGTVIQSVCDWNRKRVDPSKSNGSRGWGGLVVIRSNNPYGSGSVYFSYAPLNERYVKVGDPVSVGELIGKSGGDLATGTCPGSSTEAHLHFQVDKGNAASLRDSTPRPYFPSSGVDSSDANFANARVNAADTNFTSGVTTYTYNPVVFVTGGYRWTFDDNGNRELWQLVNAQSGGVANGFLWMDGWQNPYVQRAGLTNCGRTTSCSSNIAVEADLYRHIRLQMSNDCSSNPLEIYFVVNGTAGAWNLDRRVQYDLTRGAVDLDVDMRLRAPGKWTGIITGLRIDPAQSCDSDFDPLRFSTITVQR